MPSIYNYKINLCIPSQCTACGACMNSCPKDCISFKEDEEGFIQPLIDRERCIECGSCMSACPKINKKRITFVLENRYEKPIFKGCWHKNAQIRSQSSSGGAFTALAQYVLLNKGIVFGAKFTSNLKVVHDFASDLNMLDVLRRSKYLQSDIGFSFRKVKYFLKQGRLVLFCGTPCQIDGLYGYLNRDYDNLLTVSLVCHGAPSYDIFRKYISWIENRYRGKVSSFNFRSKKKGWDDGAISLVRFNYTEKDIILKGKENSFQTALLKNLCLRKSCYCCSSNGICRSSDFTISDLWAVFRLSDISNYDCPHMGISMLAINSEKGREAFDKGICNYLYFTSLSDDVVTIDNPQYIKSAIYNRERDMFLCEIKNGKTWDEIYKKYLKSSIYEKLVLGIKLIFPPSVSFYIKRFIKRLIR